jgi:hypothetical protein
MLLLPAATAQTVVQRHAMQQGMGVRTAVLAGMSGGTRCRSSRVQLLLVVMLLVSAAEALLASVLLQQKKRQQQQQAGTSVRIYR